jgi:hypothetical protein
MGEFAGVCGATRQADAATDASTADKSAAAHEYAGATTADSGASNFNANTAPPDGDTNAGRANGATNRRARSVTGAHAAAY